MFYLLTAHLNGIKQRYQPTAFYLGQKQKAAFEDYINDAVVNSWSVKEFEGKEGVRLLDTPVYWTEDKDHIGFSVDVSDYWPVRK